MPYFIGGVADPGRGWGDRQRLAGDRGDVRVVGLERVHQPDLSPPLVEHLGVAEAVGQAHLDRTGRRVLVPRAGQAVGLQGVRERAGIAAGLRLLADHG